MSQKVNRKSKDHTKFCDEMFYTIACTLLIGYWIYRSILNYFSPLRHIPEPRRYWLLKHLPHFLKAKDELDLHSNWAEQFKEHGMYKLETFASKPSFSFFSQVAFVMNLLQNV